MIDKLLTVVIVFALISLTLCVWMLALMLWEDIQMYRDMRKRRKGQ